MKLYLSDRHPPFTECEWRAKFHDAWHNTLQRYWTIIECRDEDVEQVKHLFRFNRLVEFVDEKIDGFARERLGLGMNQPLPWDARASENQTET